MTTNVDTDAPSRPAMPTSFHAACTKCFQPVHVRQKTCPNCGEINARRADADELKLVKHEIDTGPHVVTKDFSCMIGISLRSFQEGTVITDADLIETLKEMDAAIAPKSVDNSATMECPHCHRLFLAKSAEQPLEFSPETAEKIRRLGVSL